MGLTVVGAVDVPVDVSECVLVDSDDHLVAVWDVCSCSGGVVDEPFRDPGQGFGVRYQRSAGFVVDVLCSAKGCFDLGSPFGAKRPAKPPLAVVVMAKAQVLVAHRDGIVAFGCELCHGAHQPGKLGTCRDLGCFDELCFVGRGGNR